MKKRVEMRSRDQDIVIVDDEDAADVTTAHNVMRATKKRATAGAKEAVEVVDEAVELAKPAPHKAVMDAPLVRRHVASKLKAKAKAKAKAANEKPKVIVVMRRAMRREAEDDEDDEFADDGDDDSDEHRSRRISNWTEVRESFIIVIIILRIKHTGGHASIDQRPRVARQSLDGDRSSVEEQVHRCSVRATLSPRESSRSAPWSVES